MESNKDKMEEFLGNNAIRWDKEKRKTVITSGSIRPFVSQLGDSLGYVRQIDAIQSIFERAPHGSMVRHNALLMLEKECRKKVMETTNIRELFELLSYAPPKEGKIRQMILRRIMKFSGRKEKILQEVIAEADPETEVRYDAMRKYVEYFGNSFRYYERLYNILQGTDGTKEEENFVLYHMHEFVRSNP